MTEEGFRRFYAAAKAAPLDEDPSVWTVRLDGRALKTPAKAAFAAPQAVAEAAAAEWAAQGERILPTKMPLTRAVNVAVDRISVLRADVVASIAAYGDSDLICYRAEAPEALAARQAAAWDPLAAWSAETLGAPLSVTAGVMHRPQSDAARAALTAAVAAECDLGLAALSELTVLSGSLVIGLAVMRGRLPAAAGWADSRIDETYQAELWGEDAEAEAAAAIKRSDFLAAARLAALLRGAVP